MRLLLLLFVFTAIGSFAQRGIIRYSKENGLVSNQVNDLTYDDQGFLWLATDKGIDRFDGQRFIHFKHRISDPKSISGDKIIHIVFNGKQTIYATALNKGLIAINTKSFQVENSFFLQSRDGISGNKITCFEKDDAGGIWIGISGKGLDHIDPKTRKFSNFRPSDRYKNLNAIKANTFNAILADKFNEQILWCLTDIGLFSFDKRQKKWSYYKVESKTLVEKTKLKGNENVMKSIVQDGKGNFYIGTANGSFLYFDQIQQVFKVYNDPFLSGLDVPVSGLSWRDTRYLYVCAEGKEFLLFDSRKKEFIRFEEDERYEIQPFRLVRFGSQIAICSKTLGLFLHNESQIFGTRFNFPNTAQVIQNNSGTKALFCFHDGNMELRDLDNVLSAGKKLNISSESSQMISFGPTGFVVKSRDQLLLLKQSGETQALGKLPTGEDPVHLVSDGKDHIWLVHQEKGIFEFNLKTKSWKQLRLKSYSKDLVWEEMGKINSVIWCDGKLAVAGSEGLFEMDPVKERGGKPYYLNLPNSDEVTTLYVDEQQILWAGTVSSGCFGVDLSKKEIVYQFDEKTEFPIAEVKEIVEDQNGYLWVRTTDAVIRIDYKKSVFDVLNEGNGVANIKTILCGKKSLVFVQSTSIVSSALMGAFPRSNVPEPYIQRIIVLNDTNSGLNLRTFNSDQNSIQFEFGVLDFGNIGNNKVSYRLVGLDDNWQTANNKDEVSYYNLSGGTYRFEYRVISNGKEYTAFYDFKVLNPFYLRWWFITLSIVVLMFLIWAYIRLRIRRFETTERMKAQFTADLNEMESKALQAQMNPHFLFNSLNSIRLFVLKNEVDSAANYIAKFSKLLRMILNYSRQDMITVYDEIQSMKLYMDFERLRFDNGFDFDIEISGQDVLDCQIPPLIVQPFIENAIWHGLMPRMDSKGYIHVSFKLEEKALIVTVEDNGIGRDKAKENNSRRSLKEGSVGLQITKERLKGLSFKTKKHNDVKIVDLFDENNQPTGTLVNLYFEL